MKALSLLVAVLICASCTPEAAIDAGLIGVSRDIMKRYGPTDFRVMHSATGNWLALTMRDRRFRISSSAALDSAKVIAKYTASRLPADFRPDSIKVSVLVESLNLGIYKKTQTVMRTYLPADFQ